MLINTSTVIATPASSHFFRRTQRLASAGGDQAEERWIRQSNEYTNMLVVPA